jgi:RimJ/RimL family protein N-acetyltransferase
LHSDEVSLVPFGDEHVEGLRSACAKDPEIWDIYPLCMIGDAFGPSLQFMRAMPNWSMFAVLQDDRVVGMTSYIGRGDERVEIGGTYIEPACRGGSFNFAMKRLLIDHAFACGFAVAEFRVDTRNLRSIRAVEKLGALRSGTVPGDLRTWTGYLRDTAQFSLDRDGWAKRLAGE